MKYRWAAVIILVVALTGCMHGVGWPDREAAFAAIDERRAHEVITVLASPVYEGRRSGTAGEAMAAGWIASQFKDIGLSEAPGFTDYRSTYPSPLYTIEAFTGITARGTAGESFLGDRAQSAPYAGSGTVEAGAVLAGFGVTMDGYDEYAGLDVIGKVVVILRYSAPSRSVPEAQTYLAAKVSGAASRGAAGVIIVDMPSSPSPFDMEGQTVSALPGAPPSALVSVDGARSLFWAAGLSFDEVAAQAWAGGIVSRDLAMTVRFGVTADWNPEARAYNVAGVLAGRDPTRQVLICAHHDHLGTDRTGAVYPGADDDASGVAVMLEAARAMASAKGPPPVSIWFVSFSGEEEGLLGSAAFAAGTPGLASSLVGVLNLDMMRSTSGLGVAVDSSDERMMDAVSRAIRDGASLAVIPWSGGSDHETFSRLDVPTCMVTAHGREVPWYHATTDTALDFPVSGLGTAVQDVLRVVWGLTGSP
jgi:hypothetical protein